MFRLQTQENAWLHYTSLQVTIFVLGFIFGFRNIFKLIVIIEECIVGIFCGQNIGVITGFISQVRFETSRIVVRAFAMAFHWTVEATSNFSLMSNQSIDVCHCRTISTCECHMGLIHRECRWRHPIWADLPSVLRINDANQEKEMTPEFLAC